MVAGELKLRAPTADSRAMRLPLPAACPDSGTCACPSSSASASAPSSRSRPRSSPSTCATSHGARERAQAGDERRGAADHRRPAGRGRVRRHALRPDADGPRRRQPRARRGWTTSRSSRGASPRCADRWPTGSAARLAAVDAADQDVEGPGRQALRGRQARRHAATPSRPSPATPTRRPTTSSRPSSATSRRPTASARRPTSASPALEAATRRTTLIIGALALLAALGLALALARHLARRLRALSRAAEALAEGDVDHELSVKGRDEVGRTAGALATMVEHLRYAGRRRRPRRRRRPDRRRVSRAPSATASAPPSPASWPSCAPP